MFGKTFAALIAAPVLIAGGSARADEGMWPFDEAPVTRVKDAPAGIASTLESVKAAFPGLPNPPPEMNGIVFVFVPK